ncbi:MAG: hypothetical protein QM495_10195 [Lutibacter sp.]|uniref:hypothetical protein n=1 Tax=Lutibacter sp. TaxID=1925666 RepID=UPI00385B9B05
MKIVILSPFNTFSIKIKKKITVILLISMAILVSVMRYFDSQIQHNDNPNGIISFELAKNVSTSETILNSWDSFSKTAAGISMGFDFLFLIIYALFIALLVDITNEYLWKNSKMYTVGIFLIWSVFLAAFFDSIENIALIKLLLGDIKQLWSSIAYYFATAKFFLLSISILFIILNSILILFRKKY